MLIDKRMVAKIYKKHYNNTKIVYSRRLLTGLCHYVYYIEDDNNNKLIIRIASAEGLKLLKGSIYWLRNFVGINELPVPKIIFSDLMSNVPYLIYEFYPGRDLGYVYEALTRDQKEKLAYRMVKIQHQLEERLVPSYQKHYGYLTSYEDADYHSSWNSVVKAHIDRSYERIVANEVFDLELVMNIYHLHKYFSNYMALVEPIPFLDDATTKNVLIYEGELSGIVDLDVICFGDPLYQVALTHMSLLAHHSNTEYTQIWLGIMNLTDIQKQVFYFYVLCFCIDFMSEAGMHFNREEPLVLLIEEKQKLLEVYHQLYQHVSQYIHKDLVTDFIK